MSYLLTGIIAIMLATLALVAGVSVYDSSSLDSTALSKLIESKLSHGAEAVANYSAADGGRPESIADLEPLGLPPVAGASGQGIPDGQWAMACGPDGCQKGLTLCVEMPSSPSAEAAAQAAARKMHGSVSGTCGSNDPVGTQVSVGIPL